MGASQWKVASLWVLAPLWVGITLLAAAAHADEPRTSAEPPHSAGRTQPVIRLILDLQCPHSRQAWPVYRTYAEKAGAALVLHHLPLTRHPGAAVAAQAALAARLQGAELRYVDAVLGQPQLDEAGLTAAAAAAGLDLAKFERDRRTPDTAAGLQREKQAALAFGVQATPSALMAGRGLGGVPAPAVLQRHLAAAGRRISQLAAQFPQAADLERAAVALAQPEFLAALDALRSARFAAEVAPEGPSGCLGQLYRVELISGDLAIGPSEAGITAVAYVDGQQPWTMAQLVHLRAWQAVSGERLIVRLIPGSAGMSQKVALWWAAAGRALGPAAAKAMAALPANRPWRDTDILEASRNFGVDPARLAALAAKPETTAHLHALVAQAQRTDASPGSVFINGRRWLGQVGDSGWTAALAEQRRTFRSAGSATGAYELLVRSGIWRQDAELDLQEPVELGDLSALPQVGSGGPEVLLLVDFASPASRAAWFMLKRWTEPRAAAGMLRVAALPGRGTLGNAVTEVLLTAAALGKTPQAVQALFDRAPAIQRPDQSPHAWMAKTLGIAPAAWQQAQKGTAPQAALDLVRGLHQRTELGEEPVIFLAGRLYTGPLDEARLEMALRFAARQASAQPAVGARSVAQEAP